MQRAGWIGVAFVEQRRSHLSCQQHRRPRAALATSTSLKRQCLGSGAIVDAVNAAGVVPCTMAVAVAAAAVRRSAKTPCASALRLHRGQAADGFGVVLGHRAVCNCARKAKSARPRLFAESAWMITRLRRQAPRAVCR